MEQKGILKLATERNDRNYTFEMPLGAPYGEAYDAAHEMLQQITKMAKEAADRVEREKEEKVEIKTDDDKEEEAN